MHPKISIKDTVLSTFHQTKLFDIMLNRNHITIFGKMTGSSCRDFLNLTIAVDQIYIKIAMTSGHYIGSSQW